MRVQRTQLFASFSEMMALHHISAPWRSADMEQRKSRILWHGNKNSVVQIYRYVTEDSFDAYMWQTLDKNQLYYPSDERGHDRAARIQPRSEAA
jgi:hypothetical protein